MDLRKLLLRHDVVPVGEPGIELTDTALGRLHLRVVVVLAPSVLPFHGTARLERCLGLGLRFVGRLKLIGGIPLGGGLLAAGPGWLAAVGRHLLEERFLEETLVEPGHDEEISPCRLIRHHIRAGATADGGAGAEPEHIFDAVLHPDNRLAIGGEDVA